jgi:hypothetical protein
MTNDPAAALVLCLLSNEPLSWQPTELLPQAKPDAAFEVVHTSLGGTPQPPTVAVTSLTTIDRGVVAKALQQTWDWPAAREIAEACAYSAVVADRFARHLPYKERWRLLRQTVAALMETAPVRAVLAPQCQRLIEPKAFLEGQQSGGDVLCGAVNVRLFKVADHGPGCMLMDTLGLASLGLLDLQCVFRGIDPDGVAALLWDYAYYVFEKGDAIADGDTVKGLKADEYWTCGRQEALVEPRRAVLDMYPGPEYGVE